MQSMFEVTDDAVRNGFKFRRTKRKHYVLPIGDSGLIRISNELGKSICPEFILRKGTPVKIGHNQAMLTAAEQPDATDDAVVLLRITALPARKRVSYGIPADQVLMTSPVVRSFGTKTHRWHELLVVMKPGQTVRAHIISVFPNIEIDPLEIHYDGASVTCCQSGQMDARPEFSMNNDPILNILAELEESLPRPSVLVFGTTNGRHMLDPGAISFQPADLTPQDHSSKRVL